MRFTPTFLDDIRERVPISHLIGQRVTFDRKKSNPRRGDHWACCPFHGEKTPSFHCEDAKGRYHCFGCGASGDHFRFLTELDGLSFPEAVERVAELAGMALPAPDPKAAEREKTRATLAEVMELAAQFFESKLAAAEGAAARSYLRGRELGSVAQRRFRMGFAPDSRNALKTFLAEKGVERVQMEECGLLVHGEDIAVSYDRFRDRIMFPILDPRGRIVAFGGRAMKPDAPAKYLNSPETELFHKSRTLFHFGPARQAAQKAGTIIVVEGYVDVIALAQAGIDHAVAPLGTALTEDQLQMIWKATSEPVLCFDGDEAGQRAAWRSADLALPHIGSGRTIRFVLLPEGQDPDDLIRAEGTEAMTRLLEGARPLVELLWTRELARGPIDTPERKADLEQRLFALVGTIGDETVRRHYGSEMRRRLNEHFGGGQGGGRSGWNGGRSGYGGGKQNYGQNYEKSGGPGGRRGGGYGGAGSGAGGYGRSGDHLAVSSLLTNSSLLRGAASMPLQEALVVAALANHPLLLDTHFDLISRQQLSHGGLNTVLAAMLDGLADGQVGNDPDALRQALKAAGLDAVLEKAEMLARNLRLWPALSGAAIEDAETGLLQTLALLERERALNSERKMAEEALATSQSEADFERLVEIRTQQQDLRPVQALIEGFGRASGRPQGG